MSNFVAKANPFINMLPIPGTPDGKSWMAQDTPMTNIAWDTLLSVLESALSDAEDWASAARFLNKSDVNEQDFLQFCSELKWMVPIINERMPNIFTNPQLPRVEVSWFDCVIFANIMSRLEGLSPVYNIDFEVQETSPTEFTICVNNVTERDEANGFRLPTAQIWEHMCRAGTVEDNYGISMGLELTDIAWFAENCSGDSAMPVGLKVPNAWGFYDTLGNVWEWCWDEA